MKRSIVLLTVSLAASLFTSTVHAQLASDRVRTFAKQQMQQPPAEQRNIQHNKLTASNRNRLASNNIVKNAQQTVPPKMRSRFASQSNNQSSNKPRMLASNSPKLRQKNVPKRPPALPVVF